MCDVEPRVLAAGRRVLAYLSAVDPLPATPCDAVLGFGMFDLSLPRFCGELFARGHARRIVFTGGIGAGTGTLGGPEADAWREELRRAHPEIGDEHIVIENRSTQTAENIAFTVELLARQRPPIALRRAIVVASPSRLRRVQLTSRHRLPGLHTVRQLPPVDFAREEALYARNGVDYLAHLAGELDRLVDYPTRGWIASEPLPAEIAADHNVLRQALRLSQR